MDLNAMFNNPEEKPLDNIPSDGGFCGIFRTIACVGDSLSSGEFEAVDNEGRKSYHDMFDYSWGQYLARLAGCKAYNFSRGGMTASEYCISFAEANDFWNPDKAAQAYIIALGVNDVLNCRQEIGTTDDIDLDDWHNNAKTFAGYYGQIIQRYKEIQPKARFFLMTMPNDREREKNAAEVKQLGDAHAELLYKLAELFPFTYVIDLRKYAPVYDQNFRELFYLYGHLNPCGYVLTAKMVAAYIDYIIRHNMKDFIQTGFIGTPFYMDRFDGK